MSLKEKYQDKLSINKNKNMLISKEDFVRLLTKMQERDEKLNKVSDGLEQLIDGYACININSDVDSEIIILLEKLTGDDEEIISWYLYEDVEKIIYVTETSSINKTENKIGIELKSFEDLYDYLKYFC